MGVMAKKKYTDEHGPTTATALRQTVAYHSTGRAIVPDSWFRSLKTATAMMNMVLIVTYWSKQLTKAFKESY